MLWGDVIRGTYRRRRKGASILEDEPDLERDVESADSEGNTASEIGSEDEDAVVEVAPTKRRGRPPNSPASGRPAQSRTGTNSKKTASTSTRARKPVSIFETLC